MRYDEGRVARIRTVIELETFLTGGKKEFRLIYVLCLHKYKNVSNCSKFKISMFFVLTILKWVNFRQEGRFKYLNLYVLFFCIIYMYNWCKKYYVYICYMHSWCKKLIIVGSLNLHPVSNKFQSCEDKKIY